MKLKSLSQKDRYGNMFSVEFFEPSIPSMIIIPEMEQGNGYNGADTSNHPGDPKGTDTVPAWLTPGENVVNAEASRIPGNQEMIDEMNDQGRAIQQSQGGPIPTYEADGGRITPPMYAEMGSYVPSEIPEWLTPDLLDSLMQVESGGDVNAVSRAGATGPYQIMPATAANPGYNTQAIAESDMRDPEISRRFAQQYLAGIQASNPDFTPAEVLQAYNAGAGRIANFKAGKGKPLAEETIEYANKVLGGIPEVGDGEVPVEQGQMPYTKEQIAMAIEMAGTDDPEAVKAILDGVPSTDTGLMSAEASTLVSPTGGAIPAPSTSPFLQGMGGATQVPVIESDLNRKNKMREYLEEQGDSFREAPPLSTEVPTEKPSIVDPLIEGIPIGPAGAGITTADIAGDIVSEDQITIKQNQDAIPVLESNLQSAEEEEKEAAKVINDKQAKGEPIYQDEILRHQKAKAKVNSLSKTVETTKTETEIAQANVDQDVPPIQNYNTETGEFDDAGIPQLDDVGIPDPTVQAKKDAAMAEAMKSFRGKTFSQPSADELKEVERLGSSPQGEGFGTEVMGYFKQMFKDLFSGPELARMAVMYAGSRLMGYDHGGSLQYSMTQYIDRVDSDVEARKKFVTSKDALEDYTGKSLQAYRDSGNLEDLIAKGETLSMTKPTGNSYLPGVGKVQRFEGSDGNEYVEYQGKMTSVNSLAGFLEPWDEDVFGRNASIASFEKSAKDYIQLRNNEAGLEADKRVYFAETELAKEAEKRYDEILRQNGVSLTDAPTLAISVSKGIDDYIKAKVAFKSKKSKLEPNSVRSYINNRTREVLTGIPMEIIGKTSAVNTDKLDRAIKRSMTIKSPKQKDYAEQYYNQWQGTYNAWAILNSELGNPQEATQFITDAKNRFEEDDPESQYSAFTLWASKTKPEEIERLLEIGKANNLF